MTPTLNRFVERLHFHGFTPSYKFIASKWVVSALSAPSLVIPSANDSVGALTIYDDGNELTVEFGQLHHTHFSAYNYDGETDEQRLDAAIEDAARFLADVFADRVFISVDYAGERCIGSSLGYLHAGDRPTEMLRMPDAPLSHNEATRSERYVWSGPANNP